MEVKKSLKIIIKAGINVQWKLDLVKNDLAETREIISLLEIAEYLVLKGKSLVTYLSAKLSFQCYKQEVLQPISRN